jgi:hypothetical protein
MKTHAIEWSSLEGHDAARRAVSTVGIARALKLAARALLAVLPAAATVVAAAWLAAAPDTAVYLQATLWASGFVFLGLAFDGPARLSTLYIATGIGLPLLALLSSGVATEFAIVAAAWGATWIAAGLYLGLERWSRASAAGWRSSGPR